MMKMMLARFIEQLQILGDREDAIFFRNPYWQREQILNEWFKENPPWKHPTRVELQELYNEKLASSFTNIDVNIEINGSSFHPSDYKAINQYLPQGYFYYSAVDLFGKKIYLLGKVKTRLRARDFEELIIDEELYSNLSIQTPAFNTQELVVGRERSSLIITWSRALALRSGSLRESEAVLISNALTSLTALPLVELIKAKLEDLAERIKNAASCRLENSIMKHERGHIAASSYLSSPVLNRCVKIAQKHRDIKAESFIKALSDSLADCIEGGRFDSILKQVEPFRLGLLSDRLCDIISPRSDPVLETLHKIEAEMIPPYVTYIKTGDIAPVVSARCELLNLIVEKCKYLERLYFEDKLSWDDIDKLRREQEERYRNIKLEEAIEELSTEPLHIF